MTDWDFNEMITGGDDDPCPEDGDEQALLDWVVRRLTPQKARIVENEKTLQNLLDAFEKMPVTYDNQTHIRQIKRMLEETGSHTWLNQAIIMAPPQIEIGDDLMRRAVDIVDGVIPADG